MADQPNLGYDKTGETDLDTFNQWFRSRPEYYAKLAEFGQDPTNVHLNDQQKQEMVKLAQSLGAVVDEGGSGQEVDDSGNFRNKSHKLKTGLIIAGIAGAALLTAGAAGVFGGAAAGGAEGATAASGLAGVEGGAFGLGDAALAGLGTGAMGAVPVGAGTAATLAGIEGGGFGLGSDAVASLGTGAMSGVPVGSTAAGIAGAAGNGAFDEAGNFIGDSTFSGGDAAALAGSGSGLGKMLGKGLGTFGDIAGGVGQAIGKANTAAGQNRLNQENLGLSANAQNITGQSAFEQELMNRAKEEDVQRGKALKDVYRASYNANPRVSPFDLAGAPKYSPQYLSVAQGLADQGEGTLKNPAQYATGALPALNPYKAIDPKDVEGATDTGQSTLSKIGDFLGPGLSTAQLIARMWGGK